jgi:hypothetical protein
MRRNAEKAKSASADVSTAEENPIFKNDYFSSVLVHAQNLSHHYHHSVPVVLLAFPFLNLKYYNYSPLNTTVLYLRSWCGDYTFSVVLITIPPVSTVLMTTKPLPVVLMAPSP